MALEVCASTQEGRMNYIARRNCPNWLSLRCYTVRSYESSNYLRPVDKTPFSSKLPSCICCDTPMALECQVIQRSRDPATDSLPGVESQECFKSPRQRPYHQRDYGNSDKCFATSTRDTTAGLFLFKVYAMVTLACLRWRCLTSSTG